MHVAPKIIGGLVGPTVIAWSGMRVKPPQFESPKFEQSRDWFSEASRRSSGACGAVCQDGRRWLDPGRRKRADPGRAHLTLNGIAVKGRFKFHHQAGLPIITRSS
jgi:hypothetical protein